MFDDKTEDVTILKEGKIPNPPIMYFICQNCGCEFSVSQKFCKKEDEYIHTYYRHPCPTCNRFIYGMTDKEYRNRKAEEAKKNVVHMK